MFFTAYLDLLVLRFGVHCSSIASLDVIFHHHIYILTFVAMPVHKTCIFIHHTILMHRRTFGRQKVLHTSSEAISEANKGYKVISETANYI